MEKSQPAQLSQYQVIKTIGQSNESQIYQVLSLPDTTPYALKVIAHQYNDHLSQCYNLHAEYKILSQITHKHIVSVNQLKIIQQKYKKREQQEICMMLMELCDTDIYKLIQSSFPTMLEISLVKKLLGQVANALRCLHDKVGICHFDVKPENIFLKKIIQPESMTKSTDVQKQTQLTQEKRGSSKNITQSQEIDYTAKLGDFGFACQVDDMTYEKCKEIWHNRSNLYLSPEVQDLAKELEKNNKNVDVTSIDWKLVDVFAFGVTLFSIIFLVSPFENEKASIKDKHYKYIYQKKYDKFWSCNSQVVLILQGIQNGHLLQDLIEKTIAYDPKDRISMIQVCNHPWFRQK